jgi:holo-[acyl-carrier protein] synthase
MVIGVGIDIIEIERVAEKIKKLQGFREFVFNEKEIAYCETKAHKYEHYAARFAAKEAFFKALGTGWVNGTSFNEITILGNDAGKPEISFIGITAITLQHIDSTKIKISLSHIKEIATAIVIIEA